MMTRVEVARSAAYYAACVAQESLEGGALAAELPEAASVAKSYCSDIYFANAGDALQLFGGVGFTWEYDVHLYFKRAKSSEHLLGNGALHRERLAALLLDEEAVS
jgi:alkylation response protein AidB-like acyl-CoA dehydrogenase